jgi:hypothetical protein
MVSAKGKKKTKKTKKDMQTKMALRVIAWANFDVFTSLAT